MEDGEGAGTMPKTGVFGNTIKPSLTHAFLGGQEGDNWPPEIEHEPRQVGFADPNPDGDKPGKTTARRIVERTDMARTTFLQAVRAYLDAMRPYYREITLEWYRRNLLTTWKDLKTLRDSGAVRTTTPSKIGERDVGALLLRWRTRPGPRGVPMDTSTQEKYLMTLDAFLAWCRNPIVSLMRKRKSVRFPRGVTKPIRVLDEDELARLRAAAETIEGWPGSVARFLVAFLPATGLRPKEIRLARLEDLEIAKGRILVSHPKGEGAWAAPDYAPVPAEARRAIEDLLLERTAYLHGEACEWILPYRQVEGDLGAWSEPMLRKLKGELARRSGVVFSLKTFRATFAQRAKDLGVPIEAISRALRHSSTETTEAFYARIRADDAFHEIEKAFDGPKIRE